MASEADIQDGPEVTPEMIEAYASWCDRYGIEEASPSLARELLAQILRLGVRTHPGGRKAG
jgi:hypothetical protein